MAKSDIISLFIFLIFWLGYEPILKAIATRGSHSAKDLTVVRIAWIKQMLKREVRIFDSSLLGNSINSATFFASANLILIGAIGGAMFGGKIGIKGVENLGIELAHLQIKMGLVIICLVRGFLDFIWSIRQLNYCSAVFGAAPFHHEEGGHEEVAIALGNIFEPAMSSFSQGVRAYYFALAAGAWLYGSMYLIVATIVAFSVLYWRQSFSKSAKGLRAMREYFEKENSSA